MQTSCSPRQIFSNDPYKKKVFTTPRDLLLWSGLVNAEPRGDRSSMRALFVFTPAESKRFIGKAVARLPEVVHARTEGEIAICHGGTNVCVAEEIFGDCTSRDKY